ncbi:hypothetical protein ACWD3I_24885 [Streptomyces sp. NPDC002817]|uniref:hypothetical protein n=1 Tax=Streptomyces sp. NPDC088357 TaxID=3154655 RepID=UPI0034164AC5
MARGEPSGADQELIERLSALGLTVSAAQLERWRGAGLLPGHARRWLGRGRGSVSVLEEAVVDVAAALARHARQGRDLRWTVLAWYAEAGRPLVPGAGVVPEPPWPAVREAVLWAMAHSRAHRVLAQARTAAGAAGEEDRDAGRDAFYAEAERAFAHGPAGTPDPAAVRRLLEGEAETAVVRGEDAVRRRAAVHLAAAAGMGSGEVGGALFVETLAVLLPHLDWSASAGAADQAEDEGTFDGWVSAAAVDPLALLAAAGEQEMALARARAQLLAGVGGLHLMYGLLMPDTPALAALRTAIESTGLAVLLHQLVPLLINPSGVPHALAACLTPQYEHLADHVGELLAEHAQHSLLTGPGSEHPTAQAYMETWLDRLRTAPIRRANAAPHDQEAAGDELGEQDAPHGPQDGGAQHAAGPPAPPRG